MHDNEYTPLPNTLIPRASEAYCLESGICQVFVDRDWRFYQAFADREIGAFASPVPQSTRMTKSLQVSSVLVVRAGNAVD